jgi:protein tyrosine/serine phosphatase
LRVIRRLSASTAVTSIVTALVVYSVAQAQDNSARKTSIKNFGCINTNYFRGAQPNSVGYKQLAALGVKTVIDLQKDGPENEQSLVEAEGMKFFRIRMSDSDTPSMDQADEFLRLVNDPANHPVYVHCKGGRHRTGAMTAIYRITQDGWSDKQAYQEMKQFDFSYGFGHGSLKEFVFDFYANQERSKQTVSTVAPASSSTR